MARLRASSAALVAAALLAACSSKSSPAPTPPPEKTCAGPVPVAVAGPDRTVARGTQVQLDAGAGATEGDVSYVWRLEATPRGSGAALSSATEPRPTFTADAPGVYVASLTVTDACATSAPDLAVVVVPNGAPVAVAGLDRDVQPGAEVVLDGSGSADPDGDALRYTWRLVSRPTGSAAALSATGEPSERFTADVAGTYVATLVVSDGFEQSAPAAVAIRAVPPVEEPPPRCPATRPVANAGADVTYTGSYYYTKTVTLSGTGSTSAGAPLSYRWAFVSVAEGSTGAWVSGGWSSTPTLYLDRTGVYVVSLVVNDGCQDSEPDTVTVTVPNHAPTLYAGSAGPNVPTGAPVAYLYASGSDPDGDTVTYAWTVAAAPEGSAATFAYPGASNPAFVPDVDGDYVLSVVASDGKLSSLPAVVRFTAANVKPVASAGADRSVSVGATVTVDASASSDANRTELQYAWSFAKRPAGSAAAFSDPAANIATFEPDVAGVYVARLVVSDGVLSASDDVVVAAWPAVQRLAWRVVDAEYSRALDRIVAVSADPSVLRLVDPLTGVDTTVALAGAPSSVSVSPDGLIAAVGHANAISIVDLQAGTAEQVAVAADVADVAVTDAGVAFAIPRQTGSEKVQISAVEVGGTETSGTSNQPGPAHLKIRPGADALYLAGSGYPSSLERFDLASGTPVLAGAADAPYYGVGCGDLWMSEAGTRIFTRCGNVYRASSAWVEDLKLAGTLATGSIYGGTVSPRHVDDSTAAGELSAITAPDDGGYSSSGDEVLRRYEAASLGLVETAPLPLALSNGKPYRWHGRFVFYRSDGTERYVLMQLDAASGALYDWGVATF